MSDDRFRRRDRLRFLVTCDRKPCFAVEAKGPCKTRVDTSLRYYHERIGIPWSYQVVLDTQRDFVQDGIRCLPAHAYLAAML